jgi:hypothetical protein
VGWSEVDDQDPQSPAGEPSGDGADREHAQQRADGTSDTAVAAARRERPPVGEHRPPDDQIEDQVVGLPPREVLAAVVDDVVGAERAHELELAGVVDTRDMSTESLGELDGERARPTAAAVDGHAPAVRGADRALERDRCRLGDRRRLGERQLVRLAGEG